MLHLFTASPHKDNHFTAGEFRNPAFKTGDCWLVGFVALRPKSTAMVIAGR